MSKLLLLHGFNNYYNRIRKEEPSEGYKSRVGASNWLEFENINFFPNDGISTKQTINFAADELPWDPDYLIVYDDEGVLVSRWFVLENKHNRKKQMLLSLRRDLLIDYAAEIGESYVYVEKGALTYSSSIPDPAFYLEEDMTLNQSPKHIEYIKRGSSSVHQNPYLLLYLPADGREHIVTVPTPDSPPGAEQLFCTFPAAGGSGTAPYVVYYTPFTTNGCRAVGVIIQALSGAGVLYDAQLFPYRPEPDSTTVTTAAIPSIQENIVFTKASSINLTFETSNYSFSALGLTSISDRVSAKVANQSDLLRICAPGGGSTFEYTPFKMNAYKEDGLQFAVKVTFRPITPYIHILPLKMRGLYNNPSVADPTQFSKDPRGLVVAGDFSLPITSDQWKTYEANNKNYMLNFNREVQSAELGNKVNLIQDVVKAISNTISTALNPFTAMGTPVSAIGGNIDIYTNQTLREDALDLKKDQFNYSLGNIKALPNLLGRLSTLAVDSQIFPYIMTYSCTEKEKDIFRDKLKWNGMKVNRIGQFKNYVSQLGSDIMYMKCKLIRCSDIKEDSHVVSEIGQELDKGFYKEIL